MTQGNAFQTTFTHINPVSGVFICEQEMMGIFWVTLQGTMNLTHHGVTDSNITGTGITTQQIAIADKGIFAFPAAILVFQA
jgi:hypothetical protein